MKLSNIKFIIMVCLFMVASLAGAVESNKPSTHDLSWIERHGKISKVNLQECFDCHNNQTTCIQCHKEVAPRSHSSGWAKRGHGIEARWNRKQCQTCHTEDSCIECHSQTQPSSHRPGWFYNGTTTNGHCKTCHYPLKETTCYVCHKSSHAPGGYNK